MLVSPTRLRIVVIYIAILISSNFLQVSTVNSVHASPALGASVVGTPEVVFDFLTQRCNATDLPDLPPQAFRDARGQVTLIAGNPHSNYRAVGNSLNTVRHQCDATYSSHGDTEFDRFRYHEWIASPYTLDGKTVYALVHNEWYGRLASPRCLNAAPIDNWVNAITMAVSNDGGAHFSQPSDYIVRHPVTRWSESFSCDASHPTRYGDINGGNIISKDGYFYNFYNYLPPPGSTDRVGVCLIRTRDLRSAASWEVWTGNGYQRSKTAPCQPVISGYRANPSVKYSDYLQSYVMTWSVTTRGNGKPRTEFFFAISHDLINWSAPIPILGTDPAWSKYASLLDPTDTSMNFEHIGQTPYLYYTKGIGNKGRNLMRVMVKFSR
jgi:hypothetical protein